MCQKAWPFVLSTWTSIRTNTHPNKIINKTLQNTSYPTSQHTQHSRQKYIQQCPTKKTTKQKTTPQKPSTKTNKQTNEQTNKQTHIKQKNQGEPPKNTTKFKNHQASWHVKTHPRMVWSHCPPLWCHPRHLCEVTAAPKRTRKRCRMACASVDVNLGGCDDLPRWGWASGKIGVDWLIIIWYYMSMFLKKHLEKQKQHIFFEHIYRCT